MTISLLKERAIRIQIALIAFFISLPLLVSSIYDAVNPRAVAVGDYFLPGYEQFRIERYERMSDRDLRFSDFRDEGKMREAYDKIAAEHQEVVSAQTRRSLFMYGTLFLVSLGYILFEWPELRRERREERRRLEEEAKENPLQRQGGQTPFRHRPVADPGRARNTGED